MRAQAAGALAVALLAGCGEDENARFDRGYRDGYNAAYATACMVRGVEIEAAWGDRAYSRGFERGEAAGLSACRREMRARAQR